jgi:hypothetical protein
MLVPHMFAQIAAIATPMSTPGTLVRLLFGMYPLMRIMLCFCRRSMIAVSAFVLPLSRVSGLVILELLLSTECPATRFRCSWIDVSADVRMVFTVRA